MRCLAPLDELRLLLRPAGGGIHVVSTGKAEQLDLLRRLYGARDAAGVEARWHEALSRIPRARVVVLGVPSDTGASLVRGAAWGPVALREGLLRADPGFPAWAEGLGIVDAGDVRVVPQLLLDEMLADTTVADVRRALYGQDIDLPVAPLSIAERAAGAILALAPRAAIVALGGDHSIAWPVLRALVRAHGPIAIVQPDAHTDLLRERQGVRICFASWAWHANELIGRSGRLVQVGIRASNRVQGDWEAETGVRQFWAEEIRRRGEDAVLADLVAHLGRIGVTRAYFSNDIDGTDPAFAPTTGAPEPGGLRPEFVLRLIREVAQALPLCGGDIVEVAPPLGSPDESRRTVEVAATYLRETLCACSNSAASESASSRKVTG
jgi:arginase family enzyme